MSFIPAINQAVHLRPNVSTFTVSRDSLQQPLQGWCRLLACPAVFLFQQFENALRECESQGDYFAEIVWLKHVCHFLKVTRFEKVFRTSQL